MTCEACKDLLALYALDALDSPERQQVAAHLQSPCPQCAGYLAQVEAILAVLPLSLPPATPSPGVRARLLERIAARETSSSPRLIGDPAPATARRPPLRRLAEVFAAGAVAAAISGLIFWGVFRRESQRVVALREQMLRQDEHLARQGEQIEQLRTSVRTTDEQVRLLQSPAVQVVSLQGSAAQPPARARVFWDQPRNAWHFYATNLKPLSEGRTYELWLINDAQKKIPAGTFRVDPSGDATLLAYAPPDAGRIAAVAVTEEPAGGTPQPTGTIQLLGKIE